MWNFIFIPHVQAFVFEKKISKTWMFNVVTHLDVGTSMTYLLFLLYTSLSHLLSNWTPQSIRTQFLDPYIFVQLQNELWCTGRNKLMPATWCQVCCCMEISELCLELLCNIRSIVHGKPKLFVVYHTNVLHTPPMFVQFLCKTDINSAKFLHNLAGFLSFIMFYFNLFSSCFSLRL